MNSRKQKATRVFAIAISQDKRSLWKAKPDNTGSGNVYTQATYYALENAYL